VEELVEGRNRLSQDSAQKKESTWAERCISPGDPDLAKLF
jgi:hypothetical protein